MVARTNGWGITLLVMVLLANLLCNNNGLDGSPCLFFVGWCTLFAEQRCSGGGNTRPAL